MEDFPYYAVLLLVASTKLEVRFVIADSYPEYSMLMASLVVNGLRGKAMREEEFGLPLDQKWGAVLVRNVSKKVLNRSKKALLSV